VVNFLNGPLGCGVGCHALPGPNCAPQFWHELSVLATGPEQFGQ